MQKFPKLESFFEPRSVVVIGASREPEKLGYGVARNLIGCGYPGDVYLVNPKGGELFGREILRSLDLVPDQVDLALVVVAAKYVPETLLACSRKDIRNSMVLTGGFRESGTEGAEIEREVEKIVAREGLRVIGPNCIGILDTHLPLDTTFIQPPFPEKGEVAFITHSGALGAAMIDWARGMGFSFSRVVSLGNQIDVSESDVLLPTAQDSHTKVVTLYLESLLDGEKFIAAAQRASALKPVIALKVGRSDAGQRAAASHTGALAGEDHVFEAAFRKAGVLRASTTEELFSWAKQFSYAPLPQGNRLAILTNAGGPGVTAADAAADWGLKLAEFSDGTRAKLALILPEAASIQNPVDMLASASPEVYGACLEALLADEAVDMALVIVPPPPMFPALDVVKSLEGAIAGSEGKPVAVALMGSPQVAEARTYLRSRKIPEYTFPEDAVSAMAAQWRYRRAQGQDGERLPEVGPTDWGEINGLLTGQHAEDFIDPEVVVAVLEAAGIQNARLYDCKSADQAVKIANEIGYPVVMKAALEGVSHKSDIGGIVLDLGDAKAVRHAFFRLEEKVSGVIAANQEFGVHLQRMVKGGQELILGAVRDPVFGPTLMLGSGGTEVEGLEDVAFSVAPLTLLEFDHMLAATWAGRKLRGFRQLLPGDIQALRESAARLSQLMIEIPEIAEVEINPLMVLPEGEGVLAVDARMRITPGG